MSFRLKRHEDEQEFSFGVYLSFGTRLIREFGALWRDQWRSLDYERAVYKFREADL